MKGFVDDIEALTEGNTDFRRVLYTGKHLQLVLMALKPGEEIGEEVHDGLDQFIRVEAGVATLTLGPAQGTVAETHELRADVAAIIPGGTWHNVVNAGHDVLKLYSLYAPPEHPDGAVHRTKAEADAAEAAHGH